MSSLAQRIGHIEGALVTIGLYVHYLPPGKREIVQGAINRARDEMNTLGDELLRVSERIVERSTVKEPEPV